MFIRLLSFCGSLVSGHIGKVYLNNQPYQAWSTLVDINFNEPLYFSFLLQVSINVVEVAKLLSYGFIYDSYFHNYLFQISVKVFNLMLEVNEKRLSVQHKLCECKCRLNENTCSSKQKWSHDKYLCESKELDDWRSGKNNYMWNPSTYDCECNKAKLFK